MSKKKFANRQLPKTDPVTAPISKQKPATSAYHGMAYWFVALLLVLPVIFSRQAQDPAITPRYILLSIFVGVFTLFFYVFTRTESRMPYPPLVKYIFLMGLALVTWSVVCLFFSVNPTAGFYEILRQLLNLVVLFLVTEMVAGNQETTHRICKVFVVVALVQSFVGILQFYDIAFKELPGANAKPFGLMANRNLFGSAQAFLVPFVLFVLYTGSRKWKYASGVALLSLIISLIISQTRAAWLAALAILIVSLLLVVVFSPANRKKWIMGSAIVVATILLVAFLLISTDKDGVLSQQVKERAASLVNAASDSTQSTENANDRLGIWKKTTELVRDHPVMGVGTGNWKLNILSYGSAGLSWSGGYFVPDRVHNVYLQMTAETGFPGLILYALFWVLIAVAGFKVMMKPVSETQRILVVLMVSGLAAFATDSMFSFPTERIEHMLYVMLMAGFILGNFIINNKPAAATTRIPAWLPLVFVFIALLNGIMGVKKHRFEKNLNYAIAYENENRFQEMMEYTEAGKNSWVNVDQVGISLQAKTGIAYRAQKNYPLALQQMNLAMKYNPNSPMVYNNLGTIYTEMNDFKTAIPYYEKALYMAPDFDIVKKNLAFNYYSIGNYKGAIKTLEKVKIDGDEFLVNMLNDARVKAAALP